MPLSSPSSKNFRVKQRKRYDHKVAVKHTSLIWKIVWLFFFFFHTVHGVLKAKILKWFVIPFSSGPHFVRELMLLNCGVGEDS